MKKRINQQEYNNLPEKEKSKFRKMYLDEAFGMGYEEDIDYCIRARKAGWKTVQVPEDINYQELNYTKEYLTEHANKNPESFPLIHKDKQTFAEIERQNWPSFLLTKYIEKPDVSIVIPTFNHLDLLKKCVESIKRHTKQSDYEVIIVANGCTDETRQYVNSLGNPFKLFWIDEQVGFIKATNEGIRQAQGEYIVLLNNDVEITGDNWIELLKKPFSYPRVGITGPVKAYRDDVKADYIIFWCCMIKREVINKIGLLDESFGIGYHEDVDYCIRAQNANFLLVQVPKDKKGQEPLEFGFPIVHLGGGTFAPIYGNSPERLQKHLNILMEKHKPKDKTLPHGWFGDKDVAFYNELVKNIPQGGRMAEVGTWRGRSLCSIADKIKEKNIHVIAVDTFKGTANEEDLLKQAQEIDVKADFIANLQRFEIEQNIEIMEGFSSLIPERVEDKSLDFIFIDAEHTEQACEADIKAWLPKLKDSGIIAGHDYAYSPGVRRAVNKIFGDRVFWDNNIWYILPKEDKKKVYDCFIFFNELDVLEIRLNELNEVVDKFVLCESRITHSGNPKPLYFEENKQRFAKFLHKIDHIILDKFPDECITTWDREHYQRNIMITSLKECKPNDVIILSDCDEILKAETVRNYKTEMGVCRVEMPLFYYKLDWQIEERWFKPRIFPFSAIGNKTFEAPSVNHEQKGTLQWFRGDGDYQVNNTIENGGWHFSFMGDKNSIRQKIQSYAHQEFNNDSFTNDTNIENAIEKGQDVFKRNLHFKKTKIDSTYPKFVQENIKSFQEKGLISTSSQREYKIYDCFSFFNELDLLEIRLAEMDNFVDFFMLSEMRQTHAGQPKPLYFEQNRDRFKKYLHKIIHVVPPDIQTNDPWVREHYQRDYMSSYVLQEPETVIIISDLDEIPRGSKIKEFNHGIPYGIRYFEQNQYSYYLNYNVGISPIAPGTFSRITTWDYLMKNNLTFTGLRYYPLDKKNEISNGGWHFSWMGGGKKIEEKLKSWAHQEFNRPELTNPNVIQNFIDQGKEHFGRQGIGETTPVEIDDTFPQVVRDNRDTLTELGLIKPTNMGKVVIIMPYHNDKENITKSVGAILGQTYKNWELVIVDDGSDSDKRASNILAYHPQIMVVEKQNGGPSSARNRGIEYARNTLRDNFKYVAFCDSDDVWDKNHLMSQLTNLWDADLVFCNVNHIFANGDKAIPYGIPNPTEYPGRETMLATPFIFISSVVMKRHCLDIGGFDSSLDSLEDLDYWLRVDEAGYKLKKNNDVAITYMVREGSMAGKRTEEKWKLLNNKHKLQEA